MIESRSWSQTCYSRRGIFLGYQELVFPWGRRENNFRNWPTLEGNGHSLLIIATGLNVTAVTIAFGLSCISLAETPVESFSVFEYPIDSLTTKMNRLFGTSGTAPVFNRQFDETKDTQ